MSRASAQDIKAAQGRVNVNPAESSEKEIVDFPLQPPGLDPVGRLPPRGSSTGPCAVTSPTRALTSPALEDRVNQALAIAMGYVLEVLAGVFRLMIAPLSVLIYLAIVALFVNMACQAVWEPTTEVICRLPGAAWLPPCRRHAPPQVVEWPNTTTRVDYPGLMALQNDALDQLLVQSNAGSQLAFDVKRAEVLVRGLTSYVLHSKLENKALIASALTQFVSDAKDTGRDLQKLSAKLYGAVASVTAFTEYAGTAIAEAKAFPNKDIDSIMQRMFLTSMETLSEQVSLSLKHAGSCIARLDRLEDSMATIHDILVKEDVLVIEQRNRLAADIWTKLGWNAEELHVHDTHLKLINGVQHYRVQAVNHVTSTMQTLETIDANLAELQGQLSSPVARKAKPITVEVQLATIHDSVHRLRKQMASTASGTEASADGLDRQMRAVRLTTEDGGL
uniref:Zn(2)-C6 fungal-type domain-containing protein n=1 Tax=Ganoderma boninense TaxID=34458 RepID=A0A5K1K0C3_9APHY|nr:Zn(2)-C6 fungal-type domain-containing protein [Ganoderma boninense]